MSTLEMESEKVEALGETKPVPDAKADSVETVEGMRRWAADTAREGIGGGGKSGPVVGAIPVGRFGEASRGGDVLCLLPLRSHDPELPICVKVGRCFRPMLACRTNPLPELYVAANADFWLSDVMLW